MTGLCCVASNIRRLHIHDMGIDSDFCIALVDECVPETLTLRIDNANRNPLIQLNDPDDGSYVELANRQSSAVSHKIRMGM